MVSAVRPIAIDQIVGEDRELVDTFLRGEHLAVISQVYNPLAEQYPVLRAFLDADPQVDSERLVEDLIRKLAEGEDSTSDCSYRPWAEFVEDTDELRIMQQTIPDYFSFRERIIGLAHSQQAAWKLRQAYVQRLPDAIHQVSEQNGVRQREVVEEDEGRDLVIREVFSAKEKASNYFRAVREFRRLSFRGLEYLKESRADQALLATAKMELEEGESIDQEELVPDCFGHVVPEVVYEQLLRRLEEYDTRRLDLIFGPSPE